MKWYLIYIVCTSTIILISHVNVHSDLNFCILKVLIIFMDCLPLLNQGCFYFLRYTYIDNFKGKKLDFVPTNNILRLFCTVKTIEQIFNMRARHILVINLTQDIILTTPNLFKKTIISRDYGIYYYVNKLLHSDLIIK